MSTQRRIRQIQRAVSSIKVGMVREVWASLCGLPVKDRMRLAWWLVIGKKELPKGGE